MQNTPINLENKAESTNTTRKKSTSACLKLEKHQLLYQYKKLNLIAKFNLLNGQYFLRLLLKKLKVAKQLFVIEIQKGDEVMIPKELSTKGMPISFTYYDGIVLIIENMMS